MESVPIGCFFLLFELVLIDVLGLYLKVMQIDTYGHFIAVLDSVS